MIAFYDSNGKRRQNLTCVFWLFGVRQKVNFEYDPREQLRDQKTKGNHCSFCQSWSAGRLQTNPKWSKRPLQNCGLWWTSCSRVCRPNGQLKKIWSRFTKKDSSPWNFCLHTAWRRVHYRTVWYHDTDKISRLKYTTVRRLQWNTWLQRTYLGHLQVLLGEPWQKKLVVTKQIRSDSILNIDCLLEQSLGPPLVAIPAGIQWWGHRYCGAHPTRPRPCGVTCSARLADGVHQEAPLLSQHLIDQTTAQSKECTTFHYYIFKI